MDNAVFLQVLNGVDQANSNNQNGVLVKTAVS